MADVVLSSLFEHPLKSAQGVAVARAEVRLEGLAHDRRFLAHTADGTFVSGRSHPALVQVVPFWDGQLLRLSAPGCFDLELSPRVDSPSSVAVWATRFEAYDQGDEAARWLSEFLGDDLRLAWLGDSQRPLRWDPDRRLTFADAAPLLALGTSSLEDLERRVGEPLSVRRFRPNLVFDGAGAFEEDTWRRLRIGEVEFLNLDGCSRCEFTTLDPDTGERHPRGEPLATLERFRKNDVGTYFGMNLMPLTTGTLRVGDRVTVTDWRRPPLFGPFELPVTSGDHFWSDGESEMVCTAVRDEAPGVKTFTLTRADGMRSTWDAGQYLTLRLDLPEGPVRRSYSITSAPRAGKDVDPEITVKLVGGGRASPWLHQHLRPGVRVVSEAIGGTFTLAAHPWNTVLLLGAGSGITPLMGMLRWILQNNLPIDVAFHQSARTATDLLFGPELLAWKARMGSRLTLGGRITSEEGHLDQLSLVRFCPDLRDRRVFVCGPPAYRATVRTLLANAGLKLDRRYHEELYGEAALEVPEEVEPGTVTFLNSRKTSASDGRTTVLQLAERAAIDLPSSCRSGDCGTCRIQAADGNWLLACRAFPQGDQAYKI